MGQLVLSLHAATEAVLACLDSEGDSHHKLLPIKEYDGGKKRSNVYKHFQIICRAGSKTNVEWLVCNYVLERVCGINIGLKRFFSKESTSYLLCYVETRNNACRDAVVQVPTHVKKRIYEGAIELCDMQISPFPSCLFVQKSHGLPSFVELW